MATISLIQGTLPEYSAPTSSDYDNAGTYRAIIAKATHAMDPMLQLLDMRAEAYAMIAQFEQALDDACSLIRIAPTLPIGYLRAGLIFQMRGKSAVAIKVYEEALLRVAAVGGPVLELQDRLAEATSQLERRLDPFSRLPNELLINIFDQLSENDLAQCIEVHRTWETWLQHHNLLEPFSSLEIDESSSEAAWQRLQTTSRHIRSIKLAGQPLLDDFGMFIFATSPKNFESLRSLDLKYCSFPAVTITQLISQLPLTALSIECDLLVAPPLEDILISCPTLLRLVYKATFRTRMFSADEDQQASIPGTATTTKDIGPNTCFRLQHLHVVGTTDVDSMIQCIYKRCPDLRELWTDTHLASNLLQIGHYIPNLQVFRINATASTSSADEGEPSYWSRLSSQQQQLGLRVLEIKETDSASFADFAPLIEANAGTLEELALTCSFSEAIERPFWTTFPRLSTLVLSRFDNRVQDVRTILEKCPALDSLTLQDLTIDPVLLDALCTATTLRHLTLDLCRTETAQTVDALFDHYARDTNTNKSLTSVALRRIQLTSQALCFLASIENIRRMELAQLHIIDSGDPLATFIKRLQQTSYLHHLALGPLMPVTDAHIKLLGGIASLRTVTLRHLDEVTDEGVKALPAWIKAEVIKLYSPPEIEDESSDEEDEEHWHGYAYTSSGSQ